MRQVGTLPSETQARRFAVWLVAQRIEAHAEQEQSGWVVWVRDEDQLAKQEVPIEAPVADTPKPKGKFTVQVGSYQSSDEASAALSGWKKKGYSAYTAVGTIPQKGTWYRVRIGGFPSREDAQKFLDKFKAKEKASALVVLSSS